MPPYIPPELVVDILSHVALTGSGTDLEQASLCCRLWRQFCLPHLYGQVSLAAPANEDFSEQLPATCRQHRQWTKSCQLALHSTHEAGIDRNGARMQSLKVLESSIQDLPNLKNLEIFGDCNAPGTLATISRILFSSKIRNLSLYGAQGSHPVFTPDEPLIMPYVTHLSLFRTPLRLFDLSPRHHFLPIYAPEVTSLSLSHCSIDAATLFGMTEGSTIRSLSTDSCKHMTLKAFLGAAKRHSDTLELLFYRGNEDKEMDMEETLQFPALKYLALVVESKDSGQKAFEQAFMPNILKKIEAPRLRVLGGSQIDVRSAILLHKLRDKSYYPSLRKIIWAEGSWPDEATMEEMDGIQMVSMTRRKLHSYFAGLTELT